MGASKYRWKGDDDVEDAYRRELVQKDIRELLLVIASAVAKPGTHEDRVLAEYLSGRREPIIGDGH